MSKLTVFLKFHPQINGQISKHFLHQMQSIFYLPYFLFSFLEEIMPTDKYLSIFCSKLTVFCLCIYLFQGSRFQLILPGFSNLNLNYREAPHSSVQKGQGCPPTPQSCCDRHAIVLRLLYNFLLLLFCDLISTLVSWS